MIWVLDTSAWARREQPVVRTLLERVLEEGDELVFSPVVLLEVLRGPQGPEVAAERRRLADAFRVLPADAETFVLAAAAMERLALTGPEGHRLPVADLVTAALAHQHAAGVLHVDADFEALAASSGLAFEARRAVADSAGPAGGEHPIAGTQRALKKELSSLLHRLPTETAERILADAVERARRAHPG